MLYYEEMQFANISSDPRIKTTKSGIRTDFQEKKFTGCLYYEIVLVFTDTRNPVTFAYSIIAIAFPQRIGKLTLTISSPYTVEFDL